jgi:hypothetical protein
MTKYNPKNERIKRDYFRFQTEAKQKAQSTLKGIRKALDRFEQYNAYKDFGTFNKEQAIAFKKHLGQQKSKQSGEPLSKSCVLSTTNHLKEFFQWIAWQPGYKSKIHPPDIEYFNLSDKEISIAKSAKIKDFPTLEQIRKVIFQMPTKKMSGGGGIEYAASTIIFLSKKKDKQQDDEDGRTGTVITAHSKKARLTIEDKKVETWLNYAEGLDPYYGLLDLAEKFGLVKKVSTKYEFPNGDKVFEKAIKKNPSKYFTKDLLDEIDKHCKLEFCYGGGKKQTTEPEDIEGDEDGE